MLLDEAQQVSHSRVSELLLRMISDITTRLTEMIRKIYMVYSPKPRSDVFCFKMNFKISKLGYYFGLVL